MSLYEIILNYHRLEVKAMLMQEIMEHPMYRQINAIFDQNSALPKDVYAASIAALVNGGSKLSEINPLFKTVETLLQAQVEEGILIVKSCLEAAYAINGNKLTDEALDKLTEYAYEDGKELAEQKPEEYKNMYSARKEFVKSMVEFYQQLIQQDGKAETYADTIRQQFADEQAFRKAMQPALEASIKVYAITSTMYPDHAEECEEDLAFEVKFFEATVQQIYGNR